ncbi:MAG: TonB family protein [Steroidobacteraceae bacterium]
MALAAYHRVYELAWDGDPESSQRFRRILRTLLIIVAICGVAIPLLPTPAPTVGETEVPPQLARIMIEQTLKPPTPPKPITKPKVTARPAAKEPVRAAPERTDLARERAQRSIDKFKDQLAALRQTMAETPEETKNLTGVVGARSHAERSLITAQAGEASAGITSAPMSRGFGGGAGSLHGTDAARVTSSILQSGLNSHAPVGRGGAAGRSEEEIALIFDRNKGAIYALYQRALRTNPMLQGKLVLEFTIAASGEVTRCRVVSSELHDPALEREIVARVMLFRFAPEKVDPTTATKPIDFFPA